MSRGPALFLALLRAEGTRAMHERVVDHLELARRRGGFRRVAPAELPAVDVLHVTATPPVPWLGGVPAQLADRLPESERLGPVALLFPWRDGMRLQVAAHGRRAWSWIPGRPAGDATPRDATWSRAVDAAMRQLGARLLHVEGAAGIPHESLRERLGEHPVVLSLHDFALVCPRPNLFDERLGRDCGGCADAATCGACLAAAGRREAALAPRWRDTGRALLAGASAVVYPSAFLRDAYARILGATGAAEVIAPGITPARVAPARPEHGGPPRVAYVGGGAPHKGADLLAQVIAEWQRRDLPPLRWHVLGGGGIDRLRALGALPGVTVDGYYRQGSLPARLRAERIDLVLLLSRLQESFSLALSEAMAAALPVLATPAGALVDRVPAAGGALVDEPAGVDEVIAALLRWRAGGPPLPPAPRPVPLAAESAAAVHALHARLLAGAARVATDTAPAPASAPAAPGGAPFDYPAERGDGVRHVAARLERLGAGALRWARGEASVADLRRARRAQASPGATPAPLPAGRPVLYLPALPWTFRFQRPQQMARALTAAGHPVLYVEGFRRARWQPRRQLVAGPVPRLELALGGRPDPFREELAPAAVEAAADAILAGVRRAPLLVLAQLPFWAPLALRLRERLGVPLVYDRIDLHLGFPGVPRSIARLEGELMATADLVIASSPPLHESCAGVARRRALVPNAVAREDFAPSERRCGPPVVVGYVGALAPWFDVAAVEALAVAHPDWRLRLAGRVESEAVRALGRLPNVELVGEIPYADLPGFLASLQALLVPFLDQPLTRAVDPVKLYEGLAAGLPVVSRRLPAVERWQPPLVYTYEEGGLAAAVERALAEDGAAAVAERRRRVERETWDARAAQLLALVAEIGAPGVAAAPPSAALPR